MKAGDTNFLKLMETQMKQYLIPIYQRTYSWAEKQCQTLWDDILRVSESESEKARHFIGSVVCYKTTEIEIPGKLTQEIVIDGQQRITTLSLLLIAISRCYEKNEITKQTAQIIREKYLTNNYQNGDEKYKLLPTNKDKETYIALINGNENEVKEPSKEILNNFQFFMGLLEDNEENVTKAYIGLQKLDLVYIGLSTESDNPQTIFESMNSTGLGLTQGDLLRNYLLLDLEPEKQEELYTKYWRPIELDFTADGYKEKFDYFLRDYLMMIERRTVKLDAGYEEFKDYYEEKDLSKEDLLIGLRRYAKYYSRIFRCSDPNQELNALWNELKIQRVDVANPFLIQVYNDYELAMEDESINLTKQDFVDIVKAVNSYVFRRYICDIPTNSLNKTFMLLGANIDKLNYKKNIIANLLLLDDYKEFPNSAKFKEAFMKKDIYSTRLRFYILEKLENYNHNVPISLANSDVTIEHVLPETKVLKEHWRKVLGENWQELQKEYVHTIGNLTLSNRAYNSEMQDYSFKDKLGVEGGIKYSHYRISDDIVDCEKWDIEEIKKRADKLSDIALKLWEYPTMSEEELKPYKSIIRSEQGYDDMSHFPVMNPKVQEMYEDLNKRVMEFDEEINRVYAKHYVAYKYDYNNFCEIIIYKTLLSVILDIPYTNLVDEKGYSENISDKGSWGTGNTRITLTENMDVDYVVELIKQSFEAEKKED